MGSLEEYLAAAKLAELEQRQARAVALGQTRALYARSARVSGASAGIAAVLRRPWRIPVRFVRRLPAILGRFGGTMGAATTTEPLLCSLAEPDGTILATARCSFRPQRRPREAIVTIVDRPGRVVSRCLLGHVRALVLQLPTGEVLHADLLQVSFDPRQGRTLLVRLTST